MGGALSRVYNAPLPPKNALTLQHGVSEVNVEDDAETKIVRVVSFTRTS